MSAAAPHRLLFKISGESLSGGSGFGVDAAALRKFGEEIKAIADRGLQTALVIGGGNFFRGVQSAEDGMDRVEADYMGMLATVMNAIAMRDQLRRLSCPARIMSSLPVGGPCEPYSRDRAVGHLDKGRVLLLAGGSGLPFFSTDTAAVLRAVELKCDLMLKGTQVDGVYDKDPRRHPDAVRHERLSLQDALDRDLRILDGAALALARDAGLDILIFAIAEDNALIDAACRRGRFSILGADDDRRGRTKTQPKNR